MYSWVNKCSILLSSTVDLIYISTPIKYVSPSLRESSINTMLYYVQKTVSSVKSGNKTFKTDLFIFEVKKYAVLWPMRKHTFFRFFSFDLIIATRRYIIFRLSNENISFKGTKYSSLIITQNYCSLNYVSISRAYKSVHFSTLNHKIFRNKKSIT